MHMDDDSCEKKCQSLNMAGACGQGKPRKAWDGVLKADSEPYTGKDKGPGYVAM